MQRRTFVRGLIAAALAPLLGCVPKGKRGPSCRYVSPAMLAEARAEAERGIAHFRQSAADWKKYTGIAFGMNVDNFRRIHPGDDGPIAYFRWHAPVDGPVVLRSLSVVQYGPYVRGDHSGDKVLYEWNSSTES